jgi:hypothetical protein
VKWLVTGLVDCWIIGFGVGRYGANLPNVEVRLIAGRVKTSGNSTKIKLHDGETMLITIKDGAVIHFTPDMSWPHAEFVKRTTGQLPTDAWVGTISKIGGDVVAISSKHFFGYQLPGPDWVQAAAKNTFE